MGRKFQLQVPEPCHESWDNMTPADKGRFCESCQKSVIDFTGMSDAQLIAFFKRPSTGSLCGRFVNDQLNRDFEIPRKRIPWLKYLFQFSIPVFLASIKSESQSNFVAGKNCAVDTIQHCSKNELIVIARNIGAARMISGRVVDENGSGIPYASVNLKGTTSGTACDSAGFFEINISPYQRSFELIASSIGYLSSEKEFKSKKSGSVELRLKSSPALGGEVVVVGYGVTKGKLATMGAYSTVKTSYRQKINDLFKKDKTVISVFPKPARAGNEIKIQWKRADAGEYLLELFSIDGRLVKTSTEKIEQDTYLINFQLPLTSPGTYILKIANKRSGKSHVEKIIIQ